MWKAGNKEGFIELEADYARLLKCEDGQRWSSLAVNANGDLWSALKKAIPNFFTTKVTLNFICSIDSGTLIFEFPSNLKDKEINGYLQVNKNSFFNETDPLHFYLKKGNLNTETKKREYTTSYIKVSAIAKIKRFCAELGYKLGKITSLPDALFGALFRQYKDIKKDEVNLCIQIGYTKVYIIIFRGKEILSVRTMLSGSFRELENSLFSNFSISKSDARLMINDSHPQPNPLIMDSIRESQVDFITHLGGTFAELRVKNLINENSKVYLSYSVTDEPNLTRMISDRFDISVNILTGMENDEICSSSDDYYVTWISGAYSSDVPSLVPPKVITIKSLLYNPVSAVLIAILMTVVPLPIVNLQKTRLNKELEELKIKHIPVEQLVKDLNSITEFRTSVKTLVSQIDKDLEKRGLSTRIARKVAENLPVSTRLGELFVDYKSNSVKIVGYTVDTESALRYLDNVKSCEELSEADIVISDLASRRLKFEITAKIGDGKR